MPSKIRAVVFDLGNTLMYFEGAWPEVMQRADQELLDSLNAAGLALDEANFLQLFRQRLNEYYQQREAEFIEHTTAFVLRKVLHELAVSDIDEQLLEDSLERLYAVTQQHWIVEEDSIPTLAALREEGYSIGFISNAGNDADVQHQVDKGLLRPYTDFVLSSAACGVRKPNPRIFEIALENWSFAPHQVAMVGDTLGADILGARNTGLFSIWLTRHADTPANRDHADTIHPDAQIEALSELPNLLKTI